LRWTSHAAQKNADAALRAAAGVAMTVRKHPTEPTDCTPAGTWRTGSRQPRVLTLDYSHTEYRLRIEAVQRKGQTQRRLVY